jgi:putative SOS response-associated peptidase YedK
MPAIVGAADRDAWLRGSAEDARAVLKQYPTDLMDACEVSTRVNSVKNNDPGLINPVQTRSVA